MGSVGITPNLPFPLPLWSTTRQDVRFHHSENVAFEACLQSHQKTFPNTSFNPHQAPTKPQNATQPRPCGFIKRNTLAFFEGGAKPITILVVNLEVLAYN